MAIAAAAARGSFAVIGASFGTGTGVYAVGPTASGGVRAECGYGADHQPIVGGGSRARRWGQGQ